MTHVPPEDFTYTLEAYLGLVWVDLTADVVSGTVKYRDGMATNKPLDRIADIGELSFTLKNPAGKYSPAHTGALAGWKVGVKLRLTLSYVGTNYTFILYVATPDGIQLSGKGKGMAFAYVTALDWLDYASREPIVNPGILLDKRGDEVITQVLSLIPIDPAATDLDTGIDTLPFVFDTITSTTKAYAEFAKVALSEFSYIYLRQGVAGDTLVFENARARSGLDLPTTFYTPAAVSGELREDGTLELREDGGTELRDAYDAATVDADNTFLDVIVPSGQNVINRLTNYAYPRRVDVSPQVLFRLSEPLLIGAGETVTLKANYTNPDGSGLPVRADSTRMITPEAGGAVDPYLMTMLHFNDDVAATTATDSTGRHTWTLQDPPQIVVDIQKDGFGDIRVSGNIIGRYVIFGGTANYYMTAPSSADFEFGSGAFTVGWYENRINVVADQATMARDATSTYPPFLLGKLDAAAYEMKVYMSSNGTSFDIANGKSLGKVKASRWVYYEVSRDEFGYFYLFADGRLTDKWYSAASFPANTNPFSVGRTQNTEYAYFAFDEFFIRKGQCLHKEDFEPSRIEMLSVLAGDYLCNLQADRLGTDITSYLTVDASYGTEGFAHQLTNTYTGPMYVTDFTCRGYGIYQENPIERAITDSASIAEFGTKSETLHQKYQSTLETGPIRAAHIVMLNAQPDTDIERAFFIAQQSPEMMSAFLQLGIGDMIRLQSDLHEIDNYFYIHGREFEIRPGRNVLFSWLLQKRYNLALGLSHLAVDLNAVDTTEAIDFGHVSHLWNLTNISVSAWVYKTAGSSGSRGIASVFSDASGWLLRVIANNKVSFYQKGVTWPGIWSTADNAISDGAWTHIVATRDYSDPANEAIIYVNGVSQAVTETSTQIGANADEIGNTVMIGNIRTYSQNLTRPFYGKIGAVRIYNTILSGAQVTALYNAGKTDATTETSGLMFQAPCVKTKALTSYTGALAQDKKVIDNVYNVVGTPLNTPIGEPL